MIDLDLDRFRKATALMEHGATPGEREAARNAAERIALGAGMTLEEALERVNRPEQAWTVDVLLEDAYRPV